MRFGKILVPIDFSEDSTSACEYAAYEAKHEGSEIVLLHVVIDWFLPGDPASTMIAPIRAELLEEADKHLARLAKEKLHGQKVSSLTVFGNLSIGEEICKFAAENAVSLIVIPTRGHGRVASLLLGSVTQRVIQLANCPVLVLPSKRHAE